MDWIDLARSIPAIRRLHDERNKLKVKLRAALEDLRKSRETLKSVRTEYALAEKRNTSKQKLRSVTEELGRIKAMRPFSRLHEHLNRRGIDLALDVGASTGQHGWALRASGFGGEIISFKPLTDAFAELEKACSGDERWSCYRCGLGAADGEDTINISGNSYSSSFLPVGDWATEAEPGITFVGQETTPMRRLDTLVPELTSAKRLFLMIDAQGFERSVLEGAVDVLDRIDAVQLELQCRASYEGQSDLSDMIDFMRTLGLEPILLWPGWTDQMGFLREIDVVFARSADSQCPE